MSVSHNLAVGDTVVWADKGKPDPFNGKELLVEQVYEPEPAPPDPAAAGDPRKITAEKDRPMLEWVAVAHGLKDAEPVYDEQVRHHPACDGRAGTCHPERCPVERTPRPARHEDGKPVGQAMTGCSADYRGRELAKNLKKKGS